jgi:hypothetical protein
MYSDGTQNCGIPTLQSCEQSISGAGGSCVPDTTSRRTFDSWQRPSLDQAPPGQAGSPSDPNWMPPPPGQ